MVDKKLQKSFHPDSYQMTQMFLHDALMAQCNLTHSLLMHPFSTPLKTSEKRQVFWRFQGIEKGYIGNEWVNTDSLKKYFVNARLFGHAILLPHPIGHAKSGWSKPNCTSDQDTTRDIAFCSLLPKKWLAAVVLNVLPLKVFAMRLL